MNTATTKAAPKLGPLALAIALDTLEGKAQAAFERFAASNGTDAKAGALADRLAAQIQALILAAIG